MGTLSLCHNKGVDDVNETIDMNHNVEGLEEVLNLPQDILESFEQRE